MTRTPRRFALLPLLAAALLWTGVAPVRSSEKTSARAGHGKDVDDGEDEVFLTETEIAQAVGRHAVKVRFYLQTDEGKLPDDMELQQTLQQELPFQTGGFLWDETTVVVPDAVIHEPFLRKIEVEAGGKTVPAAIKGYFIAQQALLLSIGEKLPGITPVAFQPAPPAAEWSSLRLAHYGWMAGRWGLVVTGIGGEYIRWDSGEEWLATPLPGLAIAPDGTVTGLVFSEYAGMTGRSYPWRGEQIRQADILPAGMMKEKQEKTAQSLRECAVGVTFRFRTEINDDDVTDITPEVYAAGFRLDAMRVLIPTPLTRDELARLTEIEVKQEASGMSAAATFTGALKDYEAVIATLQTPLTGNTLDLAKSPEFRPGELAVKANITYPGGKRRVRMAYDRFRGTERTRQDGVMMLTFTNESLGSAAFDLDGRLLALALAERPRPGAGGYDNESNAMFRPAPHIARILQDKDAVDPSIIPLDETAQNRMVWLGVEWQRLTTDLSRLLGVQKETRAGQSGLLVTYVYPDSPAAREGLQPHDVLLRLRVDGHDSVYELPKQQEESGFNRFHPRFGNDLGASSWLQRRNDLTELLTEIGPGKTVTLDYLRKGEPRQLTWTTETAPPDFSNAPKCKLAGIGLTVKPITYEVRHAYLRRPEASGVMVDRTEPGSPAEVSGIAPHDLVTQIDGIAITTPEHLKQEIGKRGTKAFELTLEQFGKTRLVRLNQDPEKQADE